MNTAIAEKIEKLKKALVNPHISQALKPKFEKEISRLEKEAQDLEDQHIPEQVEEALEVKIEEVKDVVVETKPKRTRKAKPSSETPSTDKPESVTQVAKRIRKDGEPWKTAVSRAGKMMSDNKKEKEKKVNKELDNLLRIVRTRKSLRDISGTSLVPDSKIKAMPKGKRVSAEGNVYYEYRDNRSDRLPNSKYHLEKGGIMDGTYAKGGEVEFKNSNLFLAGKGMDSNGNFVVKVQYPNQRAFSIQTLGNLPKSHRLLRHLDNISELDAEDLDTIESEVTAYIQEYGSDGQKKSLKKYESGGIMDGTYAKGGDVQFGNSNLFLAGKGMDSNGNFVVKVQYPNQRAFSIQTLGNLPKSHRLLRHLDNISELDADDLDTIESEVTAYIQEYGSDGQKKSLKKYENGGVLVYDVYADGGNIDGYQGKSPEQIWEKLTVAQKAHFIEDHRYIIAQLSGKKVEETYYTNLKDASEAKYEDIGGAVRKAWDMHVKQGQYEDGGTLENPIIFTRKYKDGDGDIVKAIVKYNEIFGGYDVYFDGSSSGYFKTPELAIDHIDRGLSKGNNYDHVEDEMESGGDFQPATRIIYNSLNPLSSQLYKITGDHYNSTDYEMLDGSEVNTSGTFRHKKTGKKFTPLTPIVFDGENESGQRMFKDHNGSPYVEYSNIIYTADKKGNPEFPARMTIIVDSFDPDDKPESYYDVMYRTKPSGRGMIARRIPAKSKEEAIAKLEKSMSESTTFDGAYMATESFENGGEMDSGIRVQSVVYPKSRRNIPSWMGGSAKIVGKGTKLEDDTLVFHEIIDQYDGKTAEQVWNGLKPHQRYHLLSDHESFIEKQADIPVSRQFIMAQSKLNYSELDPSVRNAVDHHVSEGQYDFGGLLNGYTGVHYTGLVGETNALSSGEMFEVGGTVSKKLKTNINRSINTPDDARLYLTELYINGETYHPEDDAMEILWDNGANPSDADRKLINKNMERVYEVSDFDPSEFIMDLYEKDVDESLEKGGRIRRTKDQIQRDTYNKEVDAYRWYLVDLQDKKAVSGFESKQDANDLLEDYDDKKRYKVLSKTSLNKFDIPNPNQEWKYEKGGSVENKNIVFNETILPNPSYKYQTIADKWLESNDRHSAKYQLAIALLKGIKDPNSKLDGMELDDSYDRLLRSLESIGESRHEDAWRTRNYTTGEAEKWATESLREVFTLSDSGKIKTRKPASSKKNNRGKNSRLAEVIALAKSSRKQGESWPDAVKRAGSELKKP